MGEFYKTVKNRKGFYVKMRFFRTKHEKPFLVRYFKWVLWFSLSFYFFGKFLNSHEPSTSGLKTSMVKHSHRALSESVIRQEPKDNHGLLNGLKVYVYELPSKYNSDWLLNERCSNHLFASEVAIHRALMKSDFRTFDPTEADFFFVPVYVSCNFSTVNGFPAIGHARALLASAVEHIASTLPFWKRSNGSDHVFVASHDYGACFHAMEDRAMADGIPEFMKNSIILQTFGVKYPHPCQNDKGSIIVPPYISPKSVQTTLSKSPIDGPRDIFAFFRGKMEVHPKNVSGRFYSKRVRTEILRKYGNDQRFYLKRHRFPGYQSEIIRSVFCLCPLGWAPWSPRLVESVALGCIPVIIADGIRLPFTAVPWSNISLTVREQDVAKLGHVLDHVSATNLSAIQRNLWDPQIRRALLFHDDVETGDATWEVLVALSTKLGRSHRRSRLSAND